LSGKFSRNVLEARKSKSTELVIASFPFASTGKCNSIVELFTSMGRDFHSTIKFNASTGEEYSEWLACGIEVAFDIKQVGFTPSSLFS